LTQRVATLANLPISAVEEVAADVRLTPGAASLVETLHAEGWVTALVSGGFSEIVGTLAASVGIGRYRANGLSVAGEVLTGATRGPVIDAAAKAEALQEFAAAENLPLARTVAIGDGANDLEMMKVAGLSIAFNAKPVVAAAADIALQGTRLDAAWPHIRDYEAALNSA